jgi:type I restriction enzyme R subunit
LGIPATRIASANGRVEIAMPTPEESARQLIDDGLRLAGWTVQDVREVNLHAAKGVGVREFSLKSGYGFADYVLFVDAQAAGVIEAKKVGTTLTGVELQAARYSEGFPEGFPAPARPLPFLYQSTGMETRFSNRLDVEPRSRHVFHFHRPETLSAWLTAPPRVALHLADLDPFPGGCGGVERSGSTPQARAPSPWGILPQPPIPRVAPHIVGQPPALALPSSLRYRLRSLPPLVTTGLWTAQERAIRSLEVSMAADRPRALIQMATGSGKTFTAISSIYPTIRDPDLDPTLEEGSQFDTGAGLITEPVPVAYNPAIPIETFDVIFTDECHRSIYNLWRQVLEYFDAHLVGLTATPSKQTFGFFNQNLVMEYNHEQAVADGVNVDFDVDQIRMRITEEGLRSRRRRELHPKSF